MLYEVNLAPIFGAFRQNENPSEIKAPLPLGVDCFYNWSLKNQSYVKNSDKWQTQTDQFW